MCLQYLSGVEVMNLKNFHTDNEDWGEKEKKMRKTTAGSKAVASWKMKGKKNKLFFCRRAI